MAEFQSFARSPEFAPRVIASPTAALERRNQEASSDLQTYVNQLTRRDQQLIEDTRFKGKDLESLAEFSSTALKLSQDILKQSKEDRDIADRIDSIFGPIDTSAQSVAEQTSIQQAEQETASLGPAIAKLNAVGQPVAAEVVKDRAKLWNGVSNERALLQDARATLPARVTELLNDDTDTRNFKVTGTDGETISGNLFILSKDPKTAYGAVRLALQLAVKERGLQYTTKTNFIDILGGTVEQVLGNTSANLIATSVSERQKDRVIQISNAGARIGTALNNVVKNNQQVDQAALESEFGKIYQESLVMNSGLSNGQINQELLRGMIKGAGSRVDIIKNNIGNLTTTPGNTVADTYPELLAEGIRAAEQLRDQETQQQAQNLAAKGIEEIRRMQENGASIQDIERRKNQLAGQLSPLNIGVATAFLGQADSIVLGPMKEEKERQVRLQIIAGRTFTPTELEQSGLNPGTISSLTNLQDDRGALNTISEVVSVQERNLRASVLKSAGVKLDASGQYVFASGWLKGADVETALQRFNTEANRHMLKYAKSLRGLTPEQQAKQMEVEYRRFVNEELSPGGSFQVLGELKRLGENGQPVKKEQESRIKESMRQYASPNASLNARPVRGISVDLSTQVNYGQQLPAGIVSQWKKGGGVNSTIELASYNETVTLVDSYKKTGQVQQGLATWAKQLGINPVVLLKHQAERYQIDMPDKPKPKPQSILQTIKTGPNIKEDQIQKIQPAITRALITEYNLNDNAAKALSYMFARLPQNTWNIVISEFALSQKFLRVINNPNSTEKQILNALNDFRALYNKKYNLK